jgi:hypothetical protein
MTNTETETEHIGQRTENPTHPIHPPTPTSTRETPTMDGPIDLTTAERIINTHTPADAEVITIPKTTAVPTNEWVPVVGLDARDGTAAAGLLPRALVEALARSLQAELRLTEGDLGVALAEAGRYRELAVRVGRLHVPDGSGEFCVSCETAEFPCPTRRLLDEAAGHGA